MDLEGTPATAEPALVQLKTDADVSVADHEAAFGAGTVPIEGDEPEQVEPPATDEKPRYRAKSQRARAEDVPRIAELTRKLREAERERDELKTKATPPPVVEAPRVTPAAAAPAPVVAASTGKPQWSAFEAKIGKDYPTWGDAQDAFADARDDWRANAAKAESEAQAKAASQKAENDKWQADTNSHIARMSAYATKNPEFTARTAAFMQQHLPSAVLAAIVRSDKSPELVDHLALHPDDVDELLDMSEGRPATDDLVARVQRRLIKLSGQAAPTGSVAGAHHQAPKPPNPVRTGPIKTGDELPGEDHSLADHEKAWGTKGRRR